MVYRMIDIFDFLCSLRNRVRGGWEAIAKGFNLAIIAACCYDGLL